MKTGKELKNWWIEKVWGWWVGRLVVLGVAAFVLLVVGLLGAAWWMPLPERLAVGDSVVVEYRDGEPAYVFLSADDKWRIGRALEEIDGDYVEALVAFEDRRFWDHWGVDLWAVGRAVLGNLRGGRVISGASTITMQLARLLEPRPRTFRSKVIEVFRAVQLEMHLSKEEVLAAYVRLLPFGKNIEGLEAAAQSYFGHSAAYLSEGEIAVLLVVPQGPNGRYPSVENVARLGRARAKVVRRLVEVGVFEASVAGEIAAVGVPDRLREFARDVPHAAMWLRGQSVGDLRIRTTLDADVQRLAERVLRGQAAEAHRLGIANGAIVVVEHGSGEVRALVGNFEFSQASGAQIPAFAVARSPGSLLKPLIFAGAIDQGVALPGFLVEDVPYENGSYRPENYSGRFMGLVELEEALSLSLNIPFVRLLGEVGVETLVGQMVQMGAKHVRNDPGYYGLSLAVGAGEVTPLEVAGFYATLARGGRYLPATVLAKGGETRGEDRAGGLAIYREGAAWLTARSMARRGRPDFVERGRLGGETRAVSWKTGTSYGHRDAWTAGFMGDFTAVVWMGNLDNRSSAALVGGERAAPLLFDVLEGLTARAPGAGVGLSEPPDDLTEIEVCAYSGHLPGEGCEHRRRVLALESSVPVRRCPYHVRRDVEDSTGLLLARNCRQGRAYRARSFVVWPPGVRRFLRDEMVGLSGDEGALRVLPTYAAGCVPEFSEFAEHAPRIVSPPVGQILLLVPGLPVDRQKVALRAEVGGSSGGNLGGLSWFVDGEFVGRSEGDGVLWWTPSVGMHTILVTNDGAQSSSQSLEVRVTQ